MSPVDNGNGDGDGDGDAIIYNELHFTHSTNAMRALTEEQQHTSRSARDRVEQKKKQKQVRSLCWLSCLAFVMALFWLVLALLSRVGSGGAEKEAKAGALSLLVVLP
jgi:hypothetical protein